VKFRLSALWFVIFLVAAAAFAGDVSGDWEFANRYLGDVSYAGSPCR